MTKVIKNVKKVTSNTISQSGIFQNSPPLSIEKIKKFVYLY